MWNYMQLAVLLSVCLISTDAAKSDQNLDLVKCSLTVACPTGYTCCPKDDNTFLCCPHPQGVCCNDKAHCCPRGYKCSENSTSCYSGDETFPSPLVHQPILQQQPTESLPSPQAVVCPDGKSECPSGNTCCKLSSGQYGCCPLPNAVCCSDGVHCCPNGYTCDVSKGTCTKGDVQIPVMAKVVAKTLPKNVVCPDEESQCPDGNTCCKLSSGQYGCCPLPNAVCCSDGVHCCPNGYTCDVSAGTCSKGDVQVPMVAKVVAKTPAKNVVCPDGESQCPDGNTCCKLSSGQYGCCPLPNAVCCSDGVHCCPNGYTCDVSAGTCSKGDVQVPMVAKVVAKTPAKNVVCPDGESECPSGNTCCKLSSGQYGCCPLPNAVCCSDGVHCCPNGYTCDVSAGTCSKGDVKIPMVAKVAAKTPAKNVVCPDGKSECPDGNTCCKLSSGQYGCCPLPSAVCCSDGVHCCPSGYTCDVSAGTCSKGDVQVPMVAKVAAKTPAKDVICPDKKSKCEDGSTCCKLSSGEYGCCPLPSAVCCTDGKHCCPNGYTCDLKQGTCLRGVRHLEFTPLLRQGEVGVKNVVCPDQSECLDYETCCPVTGGGYGCCPLPQAVCCSDLEHCCPSGYRCELSSETCVVGSKTIPMLSKHKAIPARIIHSDGKAKVEKKLRVVNLEEKLRFVPKFHKESSSSCSGNQAGCSTFHTCCTLPLGGHHCCPLPMASCCSDGLHCCPQGFSCDAKDGKCRKGDEAIPMIHSGADVQA